MTATAFLIDVDSAIYPTYSHQAHGVQPSANIHAVNGQQHPVVNRIITCKQAFRMNKLSDGGTPVVERKFKEN